MSWFNTPAQIIAFIVIGAITMGTVAVLLPIGEGPDEPAHIVRAAGLLRGQVIGHRQQVPHPVDGLPITVAGFDINETYLAAVEYRARLKDGRLQSMSRADTEASAASVWSKQTIFAEVSNTASYSPVLYVPASAALGIAHAWRLPPHTALVAARLTNVAAYLFLGSLAIGLAGAARAFVFAMLLLPMSLFLGSCIGQDGLLIAMAALAFVCVARAGDGAGGGRLYWVGVAAIAIIAIAKPPYIPFCLVLLVLRGPSLTLATRLSGFIVAAASSLAWSVFAVAQASVPFWRPPYVPGPLHGGVALARSTDAAGQIAVLTAKPSLLVSLPIDAIRAGWDQLLLQAIGILGWLDLPLPIWLYHVWFVVLALVGLISLVGISVKTATDVRGASTVIGIAVATVWLISITQYVSWTRLGWSTIDGIQGRYLIPVAALLALMPGLAATKENLFGRVVMSMVCVVSGIDAISITQLVVARYYLQ